MPLSRASCFHACFLTAAKDVAFESEAKQLHRFVKVERASIDDAEVKRRQAERETRLREATREFDWATADLDVWKRNAKAMQLRMTGRVVSMRHYAAHFEITGELAMYVVQLTAAKSKAKIALLNAEREMAMFEKQRTQAETEAQRK